MAHDVFISHSAKDKEVADAVCHRLEAAGIRCWIAPRDVHAGQAWDDAIVEALAATRLVVLVFSAAANESRAVRNEIASALDANKIVFPFRIENIVPSGGLQFHLSRVHWLDAMTPPLETHIDNLVLNAQRQLGREVAEPTVTPSPPPLSQPQASRQGSPPPSRSGATWALATVAGAALLVAIGVGGYVAMQRPAPTAPALHSVAPTPSGSSSAPPPTGPSPASVPRPPPAGPAPASPPAATPAQPAQPLSATAGMIFPDSATRMLVQSDLVGLSCGELDVARNEIFARRGRYFQRADLQTYFQKFPWYHPNTWNSELNPTEQANAALIGAVESQVHCR